MLDNAAERAVESYLTLSLMIIDSSITERGEGLWLAGSVHRVYIITWKSLWACKRTHILTNSLRVPFLQKIHCSDLVISVKSHRSFYPSSLLHSQGMASFSQEMWVGGINILQA